MHHIAHTPLTPSIELLLTLLLDSDEVVRLGDDGATSGTIVPIYEDVDGIAGTSTEKDEEDMKDDESGNNEKAKKAKELPPCHKCGEGDGSGWEEDEEYKVMVEEEEEKEFKSDGEEETHV